MSVLMVSCRMQKISIGFRVSLGAIDLETVYHTACLSVCDQVSQFAVSVSVSLSFCLYVLLSVCLTNWQSDLQTKGQKVCQMVEQKTD